MPWKLYGNYQPVDSAWFPRGFHFVETPFFAQWLIRHYTNFDPITDLDLIPNLTFYLIARGFHRTFATGVACQQRTLTPPVTWSCPTLGLASVLMLRPISPELVLFLDFWVSNIPRYFCFCYCCTPYQRLWLYNGARLVAFYDTLGIRRTYSRLKPPKYVSQIQGYRWWKYRQDIESYRWTYLWGQTVSTFEGQT